MGLRLSHCVTVRSQQRHFFTAVLWKYLLLLSSCIFWSSKHIFLVHEEGTFQAVQLWLFPSLSLCKYSQRRVSGGLWCSGPGKSPYWWWNFTGSAVFVVIGPVSLLLNSVSPTDRPRMTLTPQQRPWGVWTWHCPMFAVCFMKLLHNVCVCVCECVCVCVCVCVCLLFFPPAFFCVQQNLQILRSLH